jgi:transposase
MGKQKRPSAFSFDRYDKGRLQRAIAKAKSTRIYIRLKAILLVAQGKSVAKVAKLFGKSNRVVYYWLTTYLKQHQPDALIDASRSGRPLAAAAITDKRILSALKRNPLKLGYNTTVWTVALLARYLSEHYQCEIRPFTLYRRMKQIGLLCKRPRYYYSEKDPNRAQKKGQSSES